MVLEKVRLLKAWEHDGATFDVDQYEYLEVDPATAKKLKDDGVAEVYTETTDDSDKVVVQTGNAVSLSKQIEIGVTKAFDAMPKVERKNLNVEVGDEVVRKDGKGGFEDATEYWYACAKLWSGREIDKRLESLMSTKAVGSDEHRVISDPAGGYLAIPTQFVPNLLKLPVEADPMGAYTTKMPMQSRTVEWPARVDKDHSSSVAGGLTVAYTEETKAATTSVSTFEKVKLEAHELVGAAYVSNRLLRDSAISVAAVLTQGFQDAIASKIVSMRLDGLGVGQPMGARISPCYIEVAKETGQAADTIEWNNILKMRARCYGYSTAIWTANHDAFVTLAQMEIPVGTGGTSAWMPSAVPDRPDILCGRPIYFTEYAQTVGDEGDIVLGNWKEYIDGVRQDVTTSTSAHVRFLEREETLMVTFEHDGQPWWKSALTPINSTTTLSPFVGLAARA